MLKLISPVCFFLAILNIIQFNQTLHNRQQVATTSAENHYQSVISYLLRRISLTVKFLEIYLVFRLLQITRNQALQES